MKRILLGLLAIVFCFSLVGCDIGGGDETPTPFGTPAATPAATVAITPSTTPQLTPTPTRMGPVSYTTGLPYDGEYKPVMVVIGNSPAARPQTGLQTADVVYEVPVEGSITRFVCVFSDNVPESVMSVRSGRVPFLYIQQEWDAVFMHFGGSGDGKRSAPSYTYYGNELYDQVKIDVDGLYDSDGSKYYARVEGIRAPHNVEMYPLLAQQLYDYSPKPLGWLFEENATYEGSDGTQVNLSMCSNYEDFVSYIYDANQDVYLRYMQGETFKSAETGRQVSVKNIIVQYSSYTVESDVHYKVWKMTGSGKAVFYIGGVRIEGTWEKASATDPTIYRDADGNQIVLRPGNTWVHIHPES